MQFLCVCVQVVSSYDSVHVDWQGNLIASVFMKLETTCEIDVSIYPFDVQNCRVGNSSSGG